MHQVSGSALLMTPDATPEHPLEAVLRSISIQIEKLRNELSSALDDLYSAISDIGN